MSEEVAVTSAALTSADCPAGYNIIQGNGSNNTINGTAGNDCILGNGGSDTINGLGGNDFLIGGIGNDKLFGGDGNDTLHGEDGSDQLDGQNNDDTLHGGASSDTLTGAGGHDTLYGNDGNDDLFGNDGNDTLWGGNNGDELRGGLGDDRLFGEVGNDFLYGDENNDVLSGGTGSDECYAGSGNDVIAGGANSDIQMGEDGDDAISDSGANTINGGSGSDHCSGTSCELAASPISGCTQNSQCATSQTCVVDVGVCLPCGTVGGVGCNNPDNCPSDPNKTEPGICGCGVADTDSDADGTANCNDGCPNDAAKIAVGICGCGVADTDSDADGTANCNDGCPSDAAKVAAGVCGCGTPDTDSDADGTANCNDGCPNDAAKIAVGICGCGVADTDSDADGTANCIDGCPSDAAKIAAGICGCGVADTDSDADGTANCNDGCPNDAAKIAVGICGCGIPDTDSDADGTANCNDGCPNDAAKTAAGICGCGIADTDSDADGTANCIDGCPSDAAKITAGVCGCGTPDTDSDADGTANCNDGCPNDAAKVAVGICGCGTPDTDSDGDGVADCVDQCAGYADDQDQDEDGIPDGCDAPTTCTAESFGPGVLQGNVYLSGAITPEDLELLDGYTCIIGSVRIQDTDLVDLSALASITGIGGDLIIERNNQLTSVDGLEGVTRIGGGLDISENPVLASLRGLDQLESLAEDAEYFALAIENNAQLPACWVSRLEEQTGFLCYTRDLVPAPQRCGGNLASGSCSSLPPGFVCEPGVTGPGIFDGYVEINYLDGEAVLESLDGIQCITGGLWIANPAISDLEALSSLLAIGGGLGIYGNDNLVDLNGLRNLVTVGGSLEIVYNGALQSLDGLDELTSVGPAETSWFEISNNAALPACESWGFASRLGRTCGQTAWCYGNAGDGGCGALPPDFECEPGATGAGVYDGSIEVYDDFVLDELAGLTCVTGSLTVAYTNLTDLSALSSLQLVGGGLNIDSNLSLLSVDGLESLTHSGSISITYNTALGELSGLTNLESIDPIEADGLFYVVGNSSLPKCAVEQLASQVDRSCDEGSPTDCSGSALYGSCGVPPSECTATASGPGVYQGDVVLNGELSAEQLDAFADVSCITGSLTISQTTLVDLTAFGSLQAIAGNLSVEDNWYLTSFEGLENLSTVGGSLSIVANPNLEDLHALDQLESVAATSSAWWGELFVYDNFSLAECWTNALEDRTGHECSSDAYGQPCGGQDGEGTCEWRPREDFCIPGDSGPGVYDGSFTVDASSPPEVVAQLEGIKCITGSLLIFGGNTSDLSYLSSLETVGEDLFIFDSELTSLHGLENLESVRGIVQVWSTSAQNLDALQSLRYVGTALDISSNSELTSIEGLKQLESVGRETAPVYEPYLFIDSNTQLSSCWVPLLERRFDMQCGTPWAECIGNDGVGACTLLPPEFVCEPGAHGPTVLDAWASLVDQSVTICYQEPWRCESHDSLEVLRGVECITGGVSMGGSEYGDRSALESLKAIAGGLDITNSEFTDLIGLEQLASVGGLAIYENDELVSLNGLSGLTQLTDTAELSIGFYIGQNPKLDACWVPIIEAQVNELSEGNVGNDGTEGCATPSTRCYPGATGPGIYEGELRLTGSGVAAALAQLSGYDCIADSIDIHNSDLVDFAPLAGLREIGGRFQIYDNPSFTSVDGLEQLEYVGGSVWILDNPVLNNLSGLSNLSSVGGGFGASDVLIGWNESLPACWVETIEDQVGRLCVLDEYGYPEYCQENNGAGTCE